LSIARELENNEMVAMVLQPLGMATLGQDDRIRAREYLEDALEAARVLGNQRQIAAAMNALAQLYRLEGLLEGAQPLYENVLSVARDLGDRESIAIALLNLAMTHIGRQREDRAPTLLLEVLALAAETGSKPAGQSVIEVCAGLAALRKEWDRAIRFFAIAEAQTSQTGLHRDPADEAFLVPLMNSV